MGIILILVGAWPFLLKSAKIANFFSSYKSLGYFSPGELFYQSVLIFLGVLLLWRVRVVAEPVDYRDRRRRR